MKHEDVITRLDDTWPNPAFTRKTTPASQRESQGGWGQLWSAPGRRQEICKRSYRLTKHKNFIPERRESFIKGICNFLCKNVTQSCTSNCTTIFKNHHFKNIQYIIYLKERCCQLATQNFKSQLRLAFQKFYGNWSFWKF